MSVETFDWDSILPGEKRRTAIEVPTDSGCILLPVVAARGKSPGQTLLVSAGVHGDEYEGIRTIFEVFAELDPQEMSGSFLGLTVANPPAFWAGTRCSPLDQANLARVFPGEREGSVSQAIAFHIDQRLLSIADFYLDLHSAGIMCEMPALVGYHQPDTRARDAAFAFGMPVVWCHPTIAPGRTVSSAIAREVPALYTETRGAGRIAACDLRFYKRGVVNLLRYLKILGGNPDVPDSPIHLHGDGNVDESMTSSTPGFLISDVEILQMVTKGQLLGRLMDLWGQTIDEFRSPCDGCVALIHARPLVQPGEPLFLVTGVHP